MSFDVINWILRSHVVDGDIRIQLSTCSCELVARLPLVPGTTFGSERELPQSGYSNGEITERPWISTKRNNVGCYLASQSCNRAFSSPAASSSWQNIPLVAIKFTGSLANEKEKDREEDGRYLIISLRRALSKTVIYYNVNAKLTGKYY